MGDWAGGFPLLSLFTFAPALGMAAVLLLSPKRPDIIKTAAAAFAAVPLLVGAYVLFAFRDNGSLQYRETLPWIPGLNVYYSLGMDGLSAPMVVLSGLVGFIAVVASWGIEKQVKGYFALILLLLTGMNGVFVSLDFFLFYVFWELMLLPMYFLIGIWGGPARVYAAIKFFLYTMAGSVLMLVVLLACWYWSDGSHADAATRASVKEQVHRRRAAAWAEWDAATRAATLTPARQGEILDRHGIGEREKLDDLWSETRAASGQLRALPAGLPPAAAAQAKAAVLENVTLGRTFDLLELKERYPLFLGSFQLFGFLPACQFAALMFVFLYVAFAIKVPVFPFHTWLPWAHVEAPTAISVILAGILLKMGVYGFFRLSYAIFPTAAVAFAAPLAALGVLNILYGACCAMAQTDMKKLVAYSSVSHMGFCMLGLASLTQSGMTGAVLQMFNHGTATSMLFILVGVIYDRAHHRDLDKFGGLAQTMPRYAGLMSLAVFASLGLPGLSGFISEVLVFLGAFGSNLGQYSTPHWSFQSMTVIAALGVIVTAAYLLWMLQRVFFGPLNLACQEYPDATGREIFTLAPLAALILVFGVYPKPLLDMTSASVAELRAHVIASDARLAARKGDPTAVTEAWPPAADGPAATAPPPPPPRAATGDEAEAEDAAAARVAPAKTPGTTDAVAATGGGPPDRRPRR